MVIEITDPELLARTGGIVQGMSGSPIIQDGKIVGPLPMYLSTILRGIRHIHRMDAGGVPENHRLM